VWRSVFEWSGSRQSSVLILISALIYFEVLGGLKICILIETCRFVCHSWSNPEGRCVLIRCSLIDCSKEMWTITGSIFLPAAGNLLPPPCSFIGFLTLRLWRWRRYVPPNRRLTFTRLHIVISQKIELLKCYWLHVPDSCFRAHTSLDLIIAGQNLKSVDRKTNVCNAVREWIAKVPRGSPMKFEVGQPFCCHLLALLEWGFGSSQGDFWHTTTQTERTLPQIYAPSGIRNHDPCVRYLDGRIQYMPESRGHCIRHVLKIVIEFQMCVEEWLVVDNKEFWEELIAYFSLIPHAPHRKRRVQQLFYCCMCIRYRGNVFTEPLASNDSRIYTQT
jgi:hypothetical protein